MKFFLLINVKMATVVVILTLINGENSILCLFEHKKVKFLGIFYTYEHPKNSFMTSGLGLVCQETPAKCDHF